MAEGKQHLAFLFGRFNVEELRDIRQALSDRIDGQREQAAGSAENRKGWLPCNHCHGRENASGWRVAAPKRVSLRAACWWR